jgi:predicted nuclease of predicted toxin-antitoxin system
VRFLVDNNVPRSVTYLLRDRGHEATEVRAVLGQDAPDDAVAAYAAARGLIVVTHDRGLARRALRARLPHLWLRTREPKDRDRVAETVDEVAAAFAGEAIRVRLFAAVLRVNN